MMIPTSNLGRMNRMGDVQEQGMVDEKKRRDKGRNGIMEQQMPRLVGQSSHV